MKHKRLILVLGSLAVIATAGIALTSAIDSAAAQDIGADTLLATSLQEQGVQVAKVFLQDDRLEVTLTSQKDGAPKDTWIRTAVQREATFLASTSDVPPKELQMTILDERGNVIYRCGGPLEPQMRPVEKTVPPEALAGLEPTLSEQAGKLGVLVKDLSAHVDTKQGLIVDAAAIVGALPSDGRDAQLRWSTVGLLSELRDYCEANGKLDIDVYRLSVEDENGNVLVSYVVEPEARITRAWSAPGISPVWR
jgi:hypothetical protein